MTGPDPTPDLRAATDTDDGPPSLPTTGPADGGSRVNGRHPEEPAAPAGPAESAAPDSDGGLFTAPVPEKPPLPVGIDGGPVDVGPAQRKGRAGRNLPAAIAVGVGLGGLVLLSLLLYKPAFYAVIFAAIVIATWEMVRAVGTAGIRPPMVPLLLGGATMAGITWYGGAEWLPYGLLGTAVLVLVWRLVGGPVDYQRDVVTGLLIAAYVPFLGSFVVLLLDPGDGHLRVLAMLAAVVMSDTGGYAFGVFLGRHKLAPTVSPSKSWEGFGGSVLTAAVGGALLVQFMLDGHWYWGVVFGVAVAGASTLGDLAESLLKRDLGVKDMSTLLPGHGGLMDRLDSILIAAPVAYAVLTNLVPPG
jgi:phosphatidate cytidylyltransferase